MITTLEALDLKGLKKIKRKYKEPIMLCYKDMTFCNAEDCAVTECRKNRKGYNFSIHISLLFNYVNKVSSDIYIVLL